MLILNQEQRQSMQNSPNAEVESWKKAVGKKKTELSEYQTKLPCLTKVKKGPTRSAKQEIP